MQTLRLVTLFAPAVLCARAVIAHAQADLSGDYDGTWGPTTLAQEGLRVSGSYARHHGQITGVLDGRTMRFAWIEDDGSGRGVMVVGDDGALSGTWGAGYDDHHGGDWRLARVGASGTGVDVAPPHAGSWTLGFRYPWDVQSIPDGVLIGLGGAGLDLGVRLTDHVYVGATGESEAIVRASGPPDAPSDYDRLRAGGEVRLYFGEDEREQQHDWLGARYGIETFDEGATRGRFADLTLGTEVVLGDVAVGLGLTVGASREPPAAFASSAQQAAAKALVLARSAASTAARAAAGAPSPAPTSPYVAFGMTLVFQ
jgi:hypothetical protein